jgi:hypothetical protein
MKSTVFWDITQCSPLKVNRRFGGTCRLHLQDARINVAMLSTCFQAGILLHLFDPEEGGDILLRYVGYFQRTKWRYIPEDSSFHFIPLISDLFKSHAIAPKA